MTPFLRDIWNRFNSVPEWRRGEGRKQAMEQIKETVAFEVTDILDLAVQTIDTLNNSEPVYVNGKAAVGHGGLLLAPNKYTWLEWVQDTGAVRFETDDPDLLKLTRTLPSFRIGAMLWYDEESETIGVEVTSQLQLMAADMGLNMDTVYKSTIVLLEDDLFRLVCFRKDHDYNDEATELAGMLGGYVAAMLIILNAPYGIKKETKPAHKQWARDARKQGFELKPSHVIMIDKTKAPPPEYVGRGEPKFHKAFHFVRSHLRHFQKGGHTLVKAHWRGDPRLGICAVNDYKVRP